MYALIIPALTPFVLLAGVMGLSWWEDHVLPPADPTEAANASSRAPSAPAHRPERATAAHPLTGESAGR
ncbi:hypothetical protein GCM10010324_35640 [Streptomyces hiroshimensis]|uniref:Uncharacterized protein n=1 Tax=Streptomyces hiroshimensis TaxID=66424 RepID=A0ABQ2YK38_9ACTN|nr:hypothetical protein GCM10010324_35640 [Streptomyces hiroshimensis]